MKLVILSVLVLGQTLAAPNRLRRDAPIPPAWDVPSYRSNSEFRVGFGAGVVGGTGLEEGDGFYKGLSDEYGVPHDEYGVPHEEYGPPPELKTVTEHYCPEDEINAPFVIAPPAPEALPLLVPTKIAPYPAPEVIHEEYGPPVLPTEPYIEYGVPEVVREYVPFVPAPPAPDVWPLPVPFLREETLPYPAPVPEYGPPPTTSSAPYPPPTTSSAPYPPPTAAPTTTAPPPPPPPARVYGPPPTTSAPYPPPTEAPTTTAAPAPYPSYYYSKYESNSGLATSVDASARIVPAVRAPVKRVKSSSYIKPKIVITKKTIHFPSIIGSLAKLKRSILHAKHW